MNVSLETLLYDKVNKMYRELDKIKEDIAKEHKKKYPNFDNMRELLQNSLIVESKIEALEDVIDSYEHIEK